MAQLRPKASMGGPLVRTKEAEPQSVRIKDVDPQRVSTVSASASSSHPGKSLTGADVWTTDRSGLPICRRWNSNLCPSPCVYKRSHACSSCGRAGHSTPECTGPQPAPAWARPQMVPRHAFEISEFPIQKELTHEEA